MFRYFRTSEKWNNFHKKYFMVHLISKVDLDEGEYFDGEQVYLPHEEEILDIAIKNSKKTQKFIEILDENGVEYEICIVDHGYERSNESFNYWQENKNFHIFMAYLCLDEHGAVLLKLAN